MMVAMPLPIITSRQNPRIKEAIALRNRKQRRERGETLIYGIRETQRTLAAGVTLVEVYVCPALYPKGPTSTEVVRLEQQLADATLRPIEVSRDVFEKLAYGDRYDGVIAIAKTVAQTLDDLVIDRHSLVAVVEGIEKPGNLGALLRSADGAGVDAVIVADPVLDLFNPNTIRASVGAVFKKNIAQATTAETIALLRRHTLTTYATRPDAEQSYADADFKSGAALVFGAESTGLTNAWNDAGIHPISLPMNGIADSLNLSASAAVLFYEAWRQRR